MTRYQVITEADTRSKTRRHRTWTITADTREDAMYQAHMNHYGVLGWNATASIWTTSIEQIEMAP